MRVTRLEIINFRNYARAALVPCPGITVLNGDNAQGKTALLEAIYLCCTGRSHRTPRDREMIRWNEEHARVIVESQRLDGPHDVQIDMTPLERKSIKVGGSAISRSGELLGHITGVLFSPEDLVLIKDGPAARRRFIDMELSQIKRGYYYQLQRYSRALNQRGKLLRDALRDSALLKTLPMWDEQIAGSGAPIIEYRRAFVEKLSAHACAIHAQIAGGREQLSLRYQSALASDACGPALEEALLRALERTRDADMRRGITSVGPHRDDLLIALDGVDARAYGSQGQQRSCALSLKLSELMVMKEETGEYPVLMLDDVMSELDPQRRRQLLEALGGVQTLITCTDPEDLAGAPVGLMQRIENGRLV